MVVLLLERLKIGLRGHIDASVTARAMRILHLEAERRHVGT
jgi:hypothetical protein